jgi:alkylation response protein AidB-like acyl-CoA dehydrogenase
MDLTLTEDQALVQRTAREFLASRSGSDVWKEITSLGWPGLGFEEPFGFLETCLLIEELGRAGVPSPMVTVSSGFAAPSLRAGIASGEVYPYVAGPDTLVPYAAEAAGFVVAGESGVSLVPPEDVTCAPVEVVGLEPKYRVRISAPGEVLPGVTRESLEAYGAAATCAEMVGGAQGVLDRTVAYAKQREQFGKPIGAFQAVQHHCANMAIDVLGARFIAYEAIWRLGRGLDAAVEVSVAKSWVSEAYERVCALGHQVHGAIGFTAEHDLHRFTRHATASALNYGDADTHTDRLATLLGI